MPRTIRKVPPGAIFHVTNRGNRRHTIFHKPGDYRAFLKVLRESIDQRPARLLTFCVMPNHFHLVVKPDEGVTLSAYMQWLTSTHVRRYHAHYGLVGTGHLYQGPYRSGTCDSDVSVLRRMRYVDANPVTSKLVQRAEEWPWSGLSVRLKGDPDGLLSPPPVELPADWVNYVNQVTTALKGRTVPATD